MKAAAKVLNMSDNSVKVIYSVHIVAVSYQSSNSYMLLLLRNLHQD